MKSQLQPRQLPLVIPAGWINRQQQGAIEYFLTARFYPLTQYWRLTVTSPQQEASAPALEDAQIFLEAVREAELKTFTAVGEGLDARLTGRGLTGAALATEDRIVHLGAFRLHAPHVNEG